MVVACAESCEASFHVALQSPELLPEDPETQEGAAAGREARSQNDSADITMGIGTSGYVRVRVRNVRVARAVLAIASGHPGAKVHLGVAVFVKIDPFCATRWCAASGGGAAHCGES